MFEFTTWHASFPDFLISLWHYTVIGKHFLISNGRNRVRWVILGLLQDGACTILFANLSVNSLKGDLSNDTTFNPPLFSLVYTFNYISHDKFLERHAFVLLLSYSPDICIVQRSVWTASSLGGIWVSAGSIITDVLMRLKPWRMWIPLGRFKLLRLKPWRMWIPYGSFKLLRLKPYRMWIPCGRFKLLRLKPRKMWLFIMVDVKSCEEWYPMADLNFQGWSHERSGPSW
jgi:hypothetical protein